MSTHVFCLTYLGSVLLVVYNGILCPKYSKRVTPTQGGTTIVRLALRGYDRQSLDTSAAVSTKCRMVFQLVSFK